MQKAPTITIGIPAFNEESNIQTLLRSLLNQNFKGLILEKILVVSDASSDSTDNLVLGFKNKKVQLHRNIKRKGTAYAQNVIIKNTSSDVLVLLNADITISDTKFIKKMVAPITSDPEIGLVGAMVLPEASNNWFSNVLNHSHKIKQYVYENIDTKNNNIYLCHGRARAFSKKYYKSFRFRSLLAEDAYSYIYCKTIGLKFEFVPRAKVYFKSPNNLRDHLKQSVRFNESKKQIEEQIISRYDRKYFKIPFYLYIKAGIKGFISDPLKTIMFSFILLVSLIATALKAVEISNIWSISESTKR